MKRLTTDFSTNIMEAKDSDLAYFKCYKKIKLAQNSVPSENGLQK